MSLQLADLLPGQPDAKRALTGAAGLLAAVSEASVRSAVAETVTVTTTQQYGPTPLSYDVLFTPIADATDLVSISAGSVYTGEGPSFTIQAIGSDDTTVDLFFDPFNPDFFQTVSLASITNNTFTDFSAREIKGLRFTLNQPNPGPPAVAHAPRGHRTRVQRGARTRGGSALGLRAGCSADRPETQKASGGGIRTVTTPRPVAAHSPGSAKSR